MDLDVTVHTLDLICAHCRQSYSQLKDRGQISIATQVSQNQNKAKSRKIDLWFCCAGCRTVYDLLQSSGLDRYYLLKDNGVCLRPPTQIHFNTSNYTEWDTPTNQPDTPTNQPDTSKSEYRLYLEGVHCSACLWLIERIPTVLPQDVAHAQLDLGNSLLKIELQKEGKLSRVAQLIDSWGYRPHLIENSEQAYDLQKNENRARLIDLGVAGALASNIMLMSVPLYAGVEREWARLFIWIAAGLATASVFYSGRKFFQNVWSSLKEKSFSIDAPILMAIVIAYFYSVIEIFRGGQDVYFDSLSSLIFLLLASRYMLARLRQYGLGQRESFQLAVDPTTVQVGEITDINKIGRLDFDAVIREGRAFVNTSYLTGESLPVEVRAGDMIYAGTEIVGFGQNLNLKVEVFAIGKQTRLEKIFQEVRDKHHVRSQREKVFDLSARRLLMFVAVVAALTFIYFAMQGNWDAALRRTLALLIVTCPCALALAAPLAQTLILRLGFKMGLLIKDVDAFEEASDIQRVVFDKTGTLTYGQMEIAEMNIPKSFIPALHEMVSRSRHPISRAILARISEVNNSSFENSKESEIVDFSERSISPRLLEQWREIPGVGIEAKFAGELLSLCRPLSLRQGDVRSAVDLIYAADTVGQIILLDRTRSEAAQIISDLKSKNLKIGILSGDRNSVVQNLAKELNINSDDVFGEIDPEQKAKKIKEYEGLKQKTLFVGDGVNDALAMSCATISLAVQGGAESVLKTASIAALKPGLGSVSMFFKLAKKLRSLHRMNFIYSTLYNAIAGILAIFGLMNPLLAAIVMPLSALTVFVATYYSITKEFREKSFNHQNVGGEA
jgi:Cu2+-exporting ATPase/Cu+-exporting ATPase